MEGFEATLFLVLPVDQLSKNQGKAAVMFDHVIDFCLNLAQVHVQRLLKFHQVNSP